MVRSEEFYKSGDRRLDGHLPFKAKAKRNLSYIERIQTKTVGVIVCADRLDLLFKEKISDVAVIHYKHLQWACY